jgi:hypothetical protein
MMIMSRVLAVTALVLALASPAFAGPKKAKIDTESASFTRAALTTTVIGYLAKCGEAPNPDLLVVVGKWEKTYSDAELDHAAKVNSELMKMLGLTAWCKLAGNQVARMEKILEAGK